MVASYATELRKALDADEIVPYFQPQVELRTGLLIGFEALARWRHLAHGAIAPDVFIPLAEDIGLISTLTRNLLHKVFASAAALSTSEDISISFNISAIQFHDRSLPDQIHSAAEDTGFSLSRLVLEITESALIDNTDQALSIAQQLKTLGVRLSLDDFGTGYSSLRHLQSLPFDELKVDASFIREMSDTRESRKIVAAVIGLGHSLGLTTVAEGVETKAQADMLLRLGCDQGQGWLYGPPIPSCDLPGFLSTRPLALPAAPESSNDDRLPSIEALPAQRLAQLQAIYDGAPVGLCFIDRNLRYISINQRLAEINGAPVADHLGRLAQEMIPELFPTLEPYLRRALLGEPLHDLEFSIPRSNADGHPQTFLVSYQPVRDEANEVIGISTAVIEITKRKLAEEALRESEDHYRHSVELNPQVPWTSDPRGRILEAGPHWENSTGWRPDQALNHGWVKALHPDDVMPTLRIWKNCRRTGNPVDVEFRIGRGDGVWRWMRSRAAPRRDSTGAIIRWYGTVEDIDDRKRMEQSLQESEALLRAVFDAVPVGILITESPSGHIFMRNPRAETIFRRTIRLDENISSYRQSHAFHADGRAFESDEYPMVRAISSGESTDPEEILYHRDDGTQVWVRATAAPVRGKSGDIVGAVVAIQDIEEVRREKQELLDRVADLERQLKAKS